MPNTFSDNKIAPVNHSPSEYDKVVWGKFFATLADNKWLIAFVTVVTLTIGIAKALLDVPVYKADVMLQVEQESPSPRTLEQLAALMNTVVAEMPEMELIKSRRVLGGRC